MEDKALHSDKPLPGQTSRDAVIAAVKAMTIGQIMAGESTAGPLNIPPHPEDIEDPGASWLLVADGIVLSTDN